VNDNPELTSLRGFELLADVDDLTVSANSKLSELDLRATTLIEDDLLLTNNDALQDLSGLSALASVGGDFVIEGNGALSSLGLSSLSAVGAYDAATDTCGFRGCRVDIRYNPSLPLAPTQELLLEIGRPADEIDVANVRISDNAP